jgi:hypothetical protein
MVSEGTRLCVDRWKITNKCVEIVLGFIDAFLDFPQHVSASSCHHQGGRSALEATKARSVMWMYVDYDSSSVVSCRGMQLQDKTVCCFGVGYTVSEAQEGSSDCACKVQTTYHYTTKTSLRPGHVYCVVNRWIFLRI